MKFWKHWTIVTVMLIALGVAQQKFDLIRYLMANDSTYLTLVVPVVAILSSIYMVFTWRRVAVSENNPLWFISDAVLSLGMVGTLWGFLLVLGQAFTEIDTSSTESMTAAIGVLASGMSTALLTSLVGLISSLWLKAQLVVLEDGDA